MPQTSKRSGSRVVGAASKTAGGKSKAAEAKGAPRQGPVDPRTEDPSSPLGLSRVGKALWRRPGALTPRTAKHYETGSADAPIDFAVAMPLAPAPPIDLAPTIETVPPPVEVPAALVPTILVPAGPTAEPDPTVVTPILYDQAATIDDVTQIGPVLESRPLRRPILFRRAPKPRVRRVTRVVRHVDTWSVFKVAMVFNVFFYAVAMVAGVLLWQVAYATGTIDNVEKFFEGFGWETFKFNGGQIYHNAWIAGLFVAVGLTGLAVLMATLFNLITDLVGGIRLSVLEEEVRSRAERGTEPASVPALPPESAEGDSPALESLADDVTDDVLPVEYG